ncbi:hypothetical protein, partial [Vibrio sp. V28_P6S34P95]|uniref:hypothetical protein n=1 Tax=Vibrio sp. V28_P6S34P95 TaxID=1938680 RepID=UPI001F16D61F
VKQWEFSFLITHASGQQIVAIILTSSQSHQIIRPLTLAFRVFISRKYTKRMTHITKSNGNKRSINI